MQEWSVTMDLECDHGSLLNVTMDLEPFINQYIPIHHLSGSPRILRSRQARASLSQRAVRPWYLGICRPF